MKGFKPWRSCNSACIAAHQDYDERDDDDNNDDDDEEEEEEGGEGEEEDDEEDDEDEIKLVLYCFLLVCPSSSQYM